MVTNGGNDYVPFDENSMLNSPSRVGDAGPQSEVNFNIRDESNISGLEQMQIYDPEAAILQRMEEMLETNPVAVYKAVKELI